MNKHTYSFGKMLTNLPAMNRILQLRADQNAPVVPKGHKKQYNIWDKGNCRPAIPVDMRDFPSDADLTTAWGEGLREAQELCRRLGILFLS